MDQDEYNRLLAATDTITFPNRDDISERLRERFRDESLNDDELSSLVDAELVEELRILYSDAAENAGLDPEQGLAMLEYAAILRDLDDGYGEL